MSPKSNLPMSIGIAAVAALFFLMSTSSNLARPNWQSTLRRELPLLGHRNWIVIADSAYPLQTAPGIETIYADADQVKVVETVLAELGKTRHVRPIIFTDAELKHVTEKDAPGIEKYRTALARVLGGRPVQVLPHEQILAQLDTAGKTFKVLVIKTPLALPYTSVFLQLDCAYWNADAEKRLRNAMGADATK